MQKQSMVSPRLEEVYLLKARSWDSKMDIQVHSRCPTLPRARLQMASSTRPGLQATEQQHSALPRAVLSAHSTKKGRYLWLWCLRHRGYAHTQPRSPCLLAGAVIVLLLELEVIHLVLSLELTGSNIHANLHLWWWRECSVGGGAGGVVISMKEM